MLTLYIQFETLGCILRTPFYIYAFILDMYLNYKLVGTLHHSIVLGNYVLELCLE